MKNICTQIVYSIFDKYIQKINSQAFLYPIYIMDNYLDRVLDCNLDREIFSHLNT